MLKVKQLGVAAVITLVASAAMASNFRAGDQVYVPAAGHISSSSATFISDVFISNLNDDSVDVGVIYSTTAAGTQTQFPKILTLLPRERRELLDFVGNNLHLTNTLGQLIFNACKAGQDCTPDASGVNTNFRNISVESRIFSVAIGANPLTAPTNGQLFSGIPWYNFVSETASGAGLDKVFITGVRNTAQFRTNVGFVNASQFSTTTITATLINGATGTTIATASFTLQPLGTVQSSVTNLFPAFAVGPTSTNAYITFQQSGTTPTADGPANGCSNGCPAFFAYGSTVDNQTQDATTLEPQYLIPLTNNQITCIYSPDTAACKAGPTIHRAVKHQF